MTFSDGRKISTASPPSRPGRCSHIRRRKGQPKSAEPPRRLSPSFSEERWRARGRSTQTATSIPGANRSPGQSRHSRTAVSAASASRYSRCTAPKRSPRCHSRPPASSKPSRRHSESRARRGAHLATRADGGRTLRLRQVLPATIPSGSDHTDPSLQHRAPAGRPVRQAERHTGSLGGSEIRPLTRANDAFNVTVGSDRSQRITTPSSSHRLRASAENLLSP